MDTSKKLERFFFEDHIFKKEVSLLRNLLLESGLDETYKWNFPTYTLKNKNIVAIGKFKKHFGIWFFKGSLLEDPYNVLENAQEGKTKAMRQWKFYAMDEIQPNRIEQYISEAIDNQRKGLDIDPVIKKKTSKLIVPEMLQNALNSKPDAKKAFYSLSPAKQREYAEYIEEAKMEKTKISRLTKILPMILEGTGLNDKYR
ncbi:YdeI/OmpD-associated family protein [Maribacter sp. 4G9]|uniref:YdeI/OmpD-associated family protein n=1 Tax=Maribacter sp. 4G9 TaxID=1889777 RepID=UPI000C145CEE|nr:YdeI/OmpD-associated family protein [Maribacter sp. 4G9]PIB27519.1 hypothetical protein BFP75_00380 [Maribacter sp. 4G9]